MSDIFVAWREAVNLGCVGLTGDEACAGYYRMQDCGGLDVCDQNGDLGLRSAKDQTFSPGFDRDQENWVAHCEVQRLGWPEPIIRSFSVRDAKRAGLWQKEGPWMDYPKRMLQMRARAFALRDALRTLLKGHLEYRLPKDGGHSRKSGDGRPNIAPISGVKSRKRTKTTKKMKNKTVLRNLKKILIPNQDLIKAWPSHKS